MAKDSSLRTTIRELPGLRAWNSEPFRRFFGASALSNAGRALQQTVIGYIVFELTGSRFLLGLFAFMQMAPTLVIAPIVGVIVDSFERRRILAISFGVQATGFLLLGILALFGLLTVPLIAIIVISMGIAMSFTFPARSALVPNLVAPNALQSAIAANSILMNISRIAIPALSGLAITITGVGSVLLVGAGLYYPAALLILTVPLTSGVRLRASSGRPFHPTRAARSFISDLRDAISYIRGNPMLRASLLNDIVPFMFGMSYVALLPAVAEDTLNGGAGTLGVLLGVGGAGALIGTLAAGLTVERIRRGLVIWGGTLGWGIALIIVAISHSMRFIIPGLMLIGFFQSLYIVQNDTLVQHFTTDRFRGRVISAQSMINSLTTLGFLEIGLVAETASIGIAIAIHGVALVAMGILTLALRSSMRDLR